LKQDQSDQWKRFDRLVPALTNLFDIYEKADLTVKNKLVKAVFKHNVVYSEGAFRTPSVNNAFALNYVKTNGKKVALYRTTPGVFRAKPLCSP